MQLKVKFLNLLLCGTLLLLAGYNLQMGAPTAHAQTGPSLSIATVSAAPGATVAVPVAFQSNGNNIGAVSFSIVFNDLCLTYGTGVANVPSAFNFVLIQDVDTNANGLSDKVNVAISAISPTPVSLPATQNPIFTLNMTAKAACAGTGTPVAFAAGETSFSDASSTLPVNGTTSNGAVNISGAAPATNTPTHTPTNTPVNTPTNTPVNTPTNTPVNTPTNTPVNTPTNTPVNTPTNTPVNTPTHTPTHTPTNTPTATPLPIFTGPALIIGNVSALSGSQVAVPITYQPTNASISSLAFVIDYDQSCLAFNPADGNGNGIPDAITFFAPAGFTTAATVTGNANGEINVVISHAAQPAPSLPATSPLLSIVFTATCQPAAGVSQVAPVNFGTNPVPSFGSTTGASVTGHAVNGSVTINGPALPTATPTHTPTHTATPTHTPTNLPTGTATPTHTPTTVPATGNLLLVSASNDSGSVSGISFKDEDILAYNLTTNSWTLVFDGSDVGFGNVDLEAFDLLADGSFLLTPSKKVTIPGLGEVTPSDIVRFVPTSLGATTAGTLQWYLDGSDVGLSGDSEYLDAIAFAPDGRLLISTEGSFSAGGVSGADEDLFAFTQTSLGSTTAGSWALYFDGSRVSLTNSDEDVDAAWVDKANGQIYLSTKGNFTAVGTVNALSGKASDVFTCQPLGLGAATDCRFAAFFVGAAKGFNADVDDTALVASNQLLPFASIVAATADEVEGEQFAVGAADPSTVTDAELTDVDLDLDETLRQRMFLPVVTKQ